MQKNNSYNYPASLASTRPGQAASPSTERRHAHRLHVCRRAHAPSERPRPAARQRGPRCQPTVPTAVALLTPSPPARPLPPSLPPGATADTCPTPRPASAPPAPKTASAAPPPTPATSEGGGRACGWVGCGCGWVGGCGCGCGVGWGGGGGGLMPSAIMPSCLARGSPCPSAGMHSPVAALISLPRFPSPRASPQLLLGIRPEQGADRLRGLPRRLRRVLCPRHLQHLRER